MKSRRKVPATPNTQCQKCLQMGHGTYDCINERAYVFRPSASVRFKNPLLKQGLNTEKPPKIPKITDGDKKRSTIEESSSEEEEMKLPQKHLRKSESSGSSDSDESSSTD